LTGKADLIFKIQNEIKQYFDFSQASLQQPFASFLPHLLLTTVERLVQAIFKQKRKVTLWDGRSSQQSWAAIGLDALPDVMRWTACDERASSTRRQRRIYRGATGRTHRQPTQRSRLIINKISFQLMDLMKV
jgi:hypothetical protein